MRAKRRFHRKMTYPDGAILEAVIWELPAPTPDRPHGLKYRLYYGTADGSMAVRYDNETGKGDHRHYGSREEPYRFVDEATLYASFMADVERARRRRK
ncbi:MAG: toxin-antitoxin system TumE family protein [Sulfuricaulis sp.]